MANSHDITSVNQLRNSPEKAYAAFYKEHFGMVRHLVIHNSGSEADAKDLFQDSMIGLFELVAKPHFKLEAKPSTLIYSIARNIWLKRLRAEKRSRKIKDTEMVVHIEDYDLEKDERITRMEKAIELLGQPCKGILKAFYYRNQSMQDIANQHGYANTNHAKTQKYKCLQRLKKMAA